MLHFGERGTNFYGSAVIFCVFGLGGFFSTILSFVDLELTLVFQWSNILAITAVFLYGLTIGFRVDEKVKKLSVAAITIYYILSIVVSLLLFILGVYLQWSNIAR